MASISCCFLCVPVLHCIDLSICFRLFCATFIGVLCTTDALLYYCISYERYNKPGKHDAWLALYKRASRYAWAVRRLRTNRVRYYYNSTRALSSSRVRAKGLRQSERQASDFWCTRTTFSFAGEGGLLSCYCCSAAPVVYGGSNSWPAMEQTLACWVRTIQTGRYSMYHTINIILSYHINIYLLILWLSHTLRVSAFVLRRTATDSFSRTGHKTHVSCCWLLGPASWQARLQLQFTPDAQLVFTYIWYDRPAVW